MSLHISSSNAQAQLDGSYHETISLMTEEIQRLENEMKLLLEESSVANRTAALDQNETQKADDRRVAELVGELDERDQMVVFLLDQVRLMEEAQTAQRAEWDQLNAWVEQLEQRVDQRATNPDPGKAESYRLQIEEARRETQTVRRTAEVHHQNLDQEIARLRAQLAKMVENAGSAPTEALHAIEHETAQLRAQLAEAVAAACNAENVKESLAASRAELAESRCELELVQDGLQRRENEHHAELAALRAQHAKEAVQAEPSAHPAMVLSEDLARKMTTVDERIRAFRQHLREVHDNELEERKNRSLGSRLSRLWKQSKTSS